MARLLALIIVMALVFGVGGEGKVVEKRDISVQIVNLNEYLQTICQNAVDPLLISFCNAFMPTSTASISTTSTIATDNGDSPNTTPNSLKASTVNTHNSNPTRTYWCSLNNGSYIPLGYTFMYTECTLCGCVQSHDILCTTLQCMPTFCIDGSTPSPRQGQCCAQCAYEPKPTACVMNGVSFPHGTIVRQTGNNVQCWCQLGSFECRKAPGSLFSGLDFWGAGSAVYVVVIIILIILIIGTLLCCGSTVFFYYYYKRNQQTAQQAYAEYYNNGGWQAMPDEGQVADVIAEEKQAEAEQSQYETEQTQYETEYPTGNSEEYIPPPYALYNGSYVNEQNGKDQKYM